jgi:hypothetical protein
MMGMIRIVVVPKYLDVGNVTTKQVVGEAPALPTAHQMIDVNTNR